jgi:hypothetical protein
MKKIKQIEKKQAQFITRMTKMYKSLKVSKFGVRYNKRERKLIHSRKGFNPVTAGFVVRSFTDAKLSAIFRELVRSYQCIDHNDRIVANFFDTKVVLCRHAFGSVATSTINIRG